MISKILGITGKNTDMIHPDGERSKRNSQRENLDHHNLADLKADIDNNEFENAQEDELSLNFSKDELIIWINELNEFDCYHSINLKFMMEDEGNNIIVYLKDKKGHNLQEYFPLQIKAIHAKIKEDLAEIPKGTILNISC